MLPLMMEYESADIIFLVKSMKYPSNHFSITNFISFCATGTRSSSFLKLQHSMTKMNTQGHFYINRILEFLYPLLTLTCLSRLLSQNYGTRCITTGDVIDVINVLVAVSTIKSKLRRFFWNHFITNFDSNKVCIYHYLRPSFNCSKLPVKHSS